MQCQSPVALLYRGRGTHPPVHRSRQGVTNSAVSRTQLESWATGGNSPVDENRSSSWWCSQVARRIFRVNLRGPPRKAKYYLATDSGLVPWGKGEKYPGEGSEIVPETVGLQAVGGSLELLTACLLKNEPASYRYVARLRREP